MQVLFIFTIFSDDILAINMAFYCCTCISVISAGDIVKDFKEILHSYFGGKLGLS